MRPVLADEHDHDRDHDGGGRREAAGDVEVAEPEERDHRDDHGHDSFCSRPLQGAGGGATGGAGGENVVHQDHGSSLQVAGPSSPDQECIAE